MSQSTEFESSIINKRKSEIIVITKAILLRGENAASKKHFIVGYFPLVVHTSGTANRVSRH